MAAHVMMPGEIERLPLWAAFSTALATAYSEMLGSSFRARVLLRSAFWRLTLVVDRTSGG